VIIDNFNVVGVTVAPDETQPPLIVDPNAVLPFSIAVQSFKTIGGWRSQVSEFGCAVHLPQLAPDHVLHRLKSTARLSAMQSLSIRQRNDLITI